MKIQEKLKSIWDIYSDTFGRTIFHPQFFAKIYAWEAIEIGLKNSKGILVDIGCGRMPYRSLYLKKVDRYIGIDHPETAKMYKGDIKPDIFADATKIPLKDKSIDTVIIFMVLEHLRDPLLALKEIKRLLKKNGRIILSTVQMYPIHDEPYDYFRYTQFGLRSLFETAGFDVVSVKPQGNFWSFWALSLNVYLFKTLLELVRNNNKAIIAIVIAPFFYFITILVNVIFFIPAKFQSQKKSRFNISHVVFAKPTRS